MKNSTWLLPLLLFTLFFGSASAKDVVIDQMVVEELPGTQTSGTLAQTFTVGIAGKLDSVELLLRSSGNRTFDIRTTEVDGTPSDDASVLFNTTLPGSSDQPFTYNIDVSTADIQVNPGDVLAIVLSPADLATGIVRWASSNSTENPYAGGRGFTRNSNTGEFSTFFDTDYGFTTFVDTQQIPEPAFGLVGVCLIVAPLARRRRQN